jgi:hypothetical protein
MTFEEFGHVEKQLLLWMNIYQESKELEHLLINKRIAFCLEMEQKKFIMHLSKREADMLPMYDSYQGSHLRLDRLRFDELFSGHIPLMALIQRGAIDFQGYYRQALILESIFWVCGQAYSRKMNIFLKDKRV